MRSIGARRIAGHTRSNLVSKRGDEFEDLKGVLSVPDGGFPAAVAEIRQRLATSRLLIAGMVGSNRGWKEAPYVRCPPDSTSSRRRWSGPASGRRSSPAFPTRERARRRHARRGGATARRGRAGLDRPRRRWSATRAPTISGRRCGTARSTSFRTVMTGELFSLLKDHSILRTCCRARSRRTSFQGRRPPGFRRLPFWRNCSGCGRGFCSGRRRRRMLRPMRAAC